MRAARAQQHAQAEQPGETMEYELRQAQVITMFMQRCNHLGHSKLGMKSITAHALQCFPTGCYVKDVLFYPRLNWCDVLENVLN